MSGLARLGASLRRPVDDLMQGLEPLLDDPRGPWIWGLAALSAVVAWFVYVPVHELLHVLGCVGTGGSVSVLELQPIYGGTLLAQLLPFVEPGGDYAGRLTGFDTGGSDLVYVATDLGPYLLSVYPGVAWLRRCALASSPLRFGPAALLATAPFTNLTGDYFELASIVVTRILAGLLPGGLSAVEGLRSDDVFRTWGQLSEGTLRLGIGDPAAFATTAVSLLLALALAFATYALGGRLARALHGVREEAD